MSRNSQNKEKEHQLTPDYLAKKDGYEKDFQELEKFCIQIWSARADALYSLERYDEGDASYERAVAKEIASLDRVLELNPHDYQTWEKRGYLPLFAWFNRGITLEELGR